MKRLIDSSDPLVNDEKKRLLMSKLDSKCLFFFGIIFVLIFPHNTNNPYFLQGIDTTIDFLTLPNPIAIRLLVWSWHICSLYCPFFVHNFDL